MFSEVGSSSFSVKLFNCSRNTMWPRDVWGADAAWLVFSGYWLSGAPHGVESSPDLLVRSVSEEQENFPT